MGNASQRPRLTLTWVETTGSDGRMHMEARWALRSI